MNYKTKIKHAEEVANQLQGQQSVEAIKLALKEEEGLYEKDVIEVMVSARKILGEKYQPKIQEYLLENKEIIGAEEFSLLDREILDMLIERETQNLALQEKKKITKLMRAGESAEKVFAQTDTRFLNEGQAAAHIARLAEVKKQNSGSGRMINIAGGIGLIVLTGVLLVTTERIFYVLPFIGLGMIVKGLMTEKME